MQKGARESSPLQLEVLGGGSRKWAQPESTEKKRNKMKVTWKESEFISSIQQDREFNKAEGLCLTEPTQ